jgi:hypothetical protein
MLVTNPARLQIERDLTLRKLFYISNDGILIFGDRRRKSTGNAAARVLASRIPLARAGKTFR